MTGSWEPDPSGRHQFRWWDGQAWTDQVADNGQPGTDPLGQPPPDTPVPTGAAAAAAGGTSPPGGAGQPTDAGGGGRGRGPIVAVIVVAVALLVGLGTLVLTRGDDDDVATDGVATTTTPSSTSSSTSSTTMAPTTTMAVTTTTAPTTTAVPVTTTTSWSIGGDLVTIEPGDCSELFLQLEATQAVRFRAVESPDTPADLKIEIIGPTDQLLAAAQANPRFAGMEPDAILATFPPAQECALEGETVIAEINNQPSGGEAAYFFAPFASDRFVISVAADGTDVPVDFELVVEKGDITGFDSFNLDYDAPDLQAPFYTDPAFYGS